MNDFGVIFKIYYAPMRDELCRDLRLRFNCGLFLVEDSNIMGVFDYDKVKPSMIEEFVKEHQRDMCILEKMI